MAILMPFGANLRMVNGLGSTDCTDNDSGEPIPNCPNGLGNLIVGYNEMSLPEVGPPDRRTGSHNIIVGKEQNFSSFGGLVVGFRNEISGEFASISGGFRNTASGRAAAVSGGEGNVASGSQSSVSGGIGNSASGLDSAVSGGSGNTASGFSSAVSGGLNRTAPGDFDWVAGPFLADF